MEFLHYERDQALPLDQLALAIHRSMRTRRRDRVAVMGDHETLEKLGSLLDAEFLEPDQNYHWSGVQRRVQRHWKRILLGTYEDWFKWFMAHQRFRAFHIVVMIEPWAAVADDGLGGYYDGFLARLVSKVPYKIIVVQTARQTQGNAPSPLFVREATLAMLCGTRLSHDDVHEVARVAFVPLDGDALIKALADRWLWTRDHSRYKLTEEGEKFIQGMLPPKPHTRMEPLEVRSFFKTRKRSAARYALPRAMLNKMLLDDVSEKGWVTAYGEWLALSETLRRMASEEGSPVWNFFWGREVDGTEVEQALEPSHRLLRDILEGMVVESRLEKHLWFREVGRPTMAYFFPEKVPFLNHRCGQCAFYVPLRRRCRLWWLANKKRPFYHPDWKRAGSPVSEFDIHKMKYASRIGPHSSACTRFVDKKRDHPRKVVPERCEICGEAVRGKGAVVTCRNCGTRYVRFRGKVKVMTAYEHEFNRFYHEVTGSDAKADLDAWKRDMAGRLPGILERKDEVEDLDMMAVEAGEQVVEPPRVWPRFDKALQEKVDQLALSTDITRTLSMAMAQSALNATRRIVAFARLDAREADNAVVVQEKYLALIKDAAPTNLLTYEALVMKQYWLCYNLAVKKALQWFGPRKKSRFVMEYVMDTTARAKGYSAVDAAINYLHQRRLQQAERINAEVGFEGTCDGFLHGERYDSRGMGLLLDMIDPFKFADREELLVVILNGGVTWRDFRLETDRRGSTFYYPAQSGKAILNLVGADADKLPVRYEGHELRLADAYRVSANSLCHLVNSTKPEGGFEPFVFTATT